MHSSGTYNVRLSIRKLKIAVAFTPIHSNQVFEYRVGISMGTLLQRDPTPNSDGTRNVVVTTEKNASMMTSPLL